MTRGAAAVPALLMMFAVAGVLSAQPVNETERDAHYRLGRAALAAHDPAEAIAQLEQVGTREGSEWLAVALMMESRSPSDQFVERAFAAAGRARVETPEKVRPRADVAAALHPGDMVIAFLVGEAYTYAWAFDRDAFVGYQLPPPADIALAIDRAKAYADQNDREGLQRIAADLVPALLGPAVERLPQLKRVILVLDGPLRRLPIATLPVADGPVPLGQRVEVVTAEFSSLMDQVAREQSGPIAPDPVLPPYTWLIGGIVVALLLIAGIAAFKRRGSLIS